MRVLIVSRTFYPDPTVAAIRVTEWAKHLRDLGDEVSVVCRQYLTEAQIANHPALQGIQVKRCGDFRPASVNGSAETLGSRQVMAKSHIHGLKAGLRKTVTGIAERVSIPDVSIWAQRRLIHEMLPFGCQFAPDVVISSSPPHSIHWLAKRIARDAGAPWVVDFRDPFTIDKRFQKTFRNPITRWLTKRYESEIYSDASLVVHAIPLHQRWAKRHFPSHQSKMRLLTNGVPADLIDGFGNKDRIALAERPQLRTFCSSSLNNQTLELICRAMSKSFPGKNLVFRYCGPPAETPPSSCQGVSVEYLGRIPHRDAIEETKQADILLSYLPRHRAEGLGLSSKLFEYLATENPIIHINPTRSDRLFLKNWPQASVLHDPSVDQLIVEFKASRSWDPELLRRESARFRSIYSRYEQCQRLRNWLLDLATNTDSPPVPPRNAE